jgi:hypothetical protein
VQIAGACTFCSQFNNRCKGRKKTLKMDKINTDFVSDTWREKSGMGPSKTP